MMPKLSLLCWNRLWVIFFFQQRRYLWQAFSSVKHLISDHCSTKKKFNKLFIKYRSKIHSKMRSDWETLLSNEQKGLVKFLDYSYGLHYLEAVWDTAEVSLKFLKSPISDDLRKVASVNYGSYSNSEFGPLSLVCLHSWRRKPIKY